MLLLYNQLAGEMFFQADYSVDYVDNEEEVEEEASSTDLDDDAKEDIEIALYSQLHFDTVDNEINTIDKETQSTYDKPSKPVNLNTSKHPSEGVNVVTGNCSEIDSSNEDSSILFKLKPKKERKACNNAAVDGERHKEDVIEISDVEGTPIVIQDSDSGLEEVQTYISVNSSDVSSVSSDDSDNQLMILDEDIPGNKLKHLQTNVVGLDLLKESCPADEKDADLPRKSLVLSRYYNPITVRCYNCKQIGHISNVCPKPQKYLICHLCGMTNHFYMNCPNKICYNCEGTGHTSKECVKPKGFLSKVCSRCMMYGHIEAVCPDHWRQYHMTITSGKLVATQRIKNRKIYCCNCASSSHFGFDCQQRRMDNHSKATYQLICEYDTRKLAKDYRGMSNGGRAQLWKESDHYSSSSKKRKYEYDPTELSSYKKQKLENISKDVMREKKEKHQKRSKDSPREKKEGLNKNSLEHFHKKNEKLGKMSEDVTSKKKEIYHNRAPEFSKEKKPKSKDSSSERSSGKKQKVEGALTVSGKKQEIRGNSNSSIHNLKICVQLNKTGERKVESFNIDSKMGHSDKAKNNKEDFLRTRSNKDSYHNGSHRNIAAGKTRISKHEPKLRYSREFNESDLEHQVFSNEYWNEKTSEPGKGTRKRSRRKKKTFNKESNQRDRGFRRTNYKS